MLDSKTENCMKSAKLLSANYNVWAVVLQGKLMIVNVWQIITEDSKRPKDLGEAENGY